MSTFIFFRTFPWACASMFLRNLVPDAVPCPSNGQVPPRAPNKEVVKNGTAGTSLTHRAPLAEKQL